MWRRTEIQQKKYNNTKLESVEHQTRIALLVTVSSDRARACMREFHRMHRFCVHSAFAVIHRRAACWAGGDGGGDDGVDVEFGGLVMHTQCTCMCRFCVSLAWLNRIRLTFVSSSLIHSVCIALALVSNYVYIIVGCICCRVSMFPHSIARTFVRWLKGLLFRWMCAFASGGSSDNAIKFCEFACVCVVCVVSVIWSVCFWDSLQSTQGGWLTVHSCVNARGRCLLQLFN